MRAHLFIIAVLFLSTVAFANVIGIDFGSDYIEVAGPHSGNTVDIVLNEQSHRKTDNFIGFRNGEKYIGDQAKALAARFPLNFVTMINQLIGVTYDSSEFADFKKLDCEFETHPDERNGVEFAFGDQNGNYSVDELYAMMLHYCRSISQKDGVIDPKNVVITMPFHSSLGKRQAVLESARLMDINVLGLMHSTTAAALYYGVRRRGFGNKTIHLLVYDIGSTHTEVGIYKFTPPETQTGKKTKSSDSFGTLTTVAVVDDTLLGGRAFDLCIARVIEAEAMAKMKIPAIIGGTTLQLRKSQFSLLRAAKKAREILSANSKTPVTVEGIVPDSDFHTEISRKDIEEKCTKLFERAPNIAEEAISKAGLTLNDIDAFEMMGGASRTPKIIADLSAFLGREVDRTLNSDEAAAIGAAYYALRLSSIYRVRSFRVMEHIPFTFYFGVIPTLAKSPGSKRILVENPVIGSRRSITLNRTDDFSIQLFDSSDLVGEVAVTGVKAALEQTHHYISELQHPNNSHIVRIQLRLNESGLFEVEEADVIYRYAANVSTKTKVNVSSNEENITHQSDYLIKMKRKVVPISATVSFTRPSPLPREKFRLVKDKIFQLLDKEKKKHEAAIAKNNLEAYVFWSKSDGVLENSTALAMFTSRELDELKAKLAEVQEWLEDGEGSYETCGKETYETKLNELKQLVRQRSQSTKDTPAPESGDDGVKGDL
ncbi:hypoxia up-regulated 1 [Trypanosoma grayi]|uniref:hypoxia up-regulated 1 n=1 Tax=Trypanosoma grayi TaxID=71804 RepID=UPI0004F48705|nr:hypoxia up-regulated 1 [Trypanosoma grayi]KEG13001.1 hypoxia up-regulated 1 [Trypanosoma grayi]